MITCGPYRPITLITYNTRIKDIHAAAYVTILPDNAFTASLRVSATLSGSWDASIAALRVTLRDPADGRMVQSTRVGMSSWDGTGDSLQDALVTWGDLQEVGVELWWPVGYGVQRMYTIEVALVTLVGFVLQMDVTRTDV